MGILKDHEIIQRVCQGEKDRMEELVQRYYDDIYRFCYYKTSDMSAALDCTQETFLNLVRHIAGYKEQRKFKSYLFAIARNVCNDYYRSRQMEAGRELLDTEAGQEDKKIRQIEDADTIQKALNQLPQIQKDVIILHFYYDFKLREIAAVTGVGLATAKSRLKQGMDKLRKILREEEVL